MTKAQHSYTKSYNIIKIIFAMTSTQHQQADNHEDCQDCKRQRSLNQKYINIYNKMQTLHTKVMMTRQNITNHQTLVKQTVKSHENMIEKSKKTCQTLSKLNKGHIEELSFSIAAAVCEQKLKRKLQKENRQLQKQILMICQNRRQNDNIQEQLKNSYILSKSADLTSLLEQPEESLKIIGRQLQPVQKIRLVQQQYKNVGQINISEMSKTRTIKQKDSQYWKTGFKVDNNRKLNLWLYQGHQHITK